MINLDKVESYARENHIPVMLKESLDILNLLVSITKPRKILEIGTAIGYSGLNMLYHADPECELYTMEMEEESIKIAEKNFTDSNVMDRVHIFKGDAREIVPLVSGKFDFIMLDGPKGQYAAFLPYLKNLLNKNGILFADNVLFKGMINGKAEVKHKKITIVNNLHEYIDKIMNDKDLVSILIDRGDGISISYKLWERLNF